MKGINIFLADGFEDIEALAVNDALRRAGLSPNLVSVSGEPFVTSSHGVAVKADIGIDDCDLSACGTCRNDVMIFPGGMPGSRNLASCAPLIEVLKAHYDAGGSVAAICAAPGMVLGQLDCWAGTVFTCFDSFEKLPESKGGQFVKKAAVTSGRVITGRSAGYAAEFGIEIAGYVCGPAKAAEVRAAMLLDIQ